MQVPFNEQIRLLNDYLKVETDKYKQVRIKLEIARLIDKRIETINHKIEEHSTSDYMIINSKMNSL